MILVGYNNNTSSIPQQQPQQQQQYQGNFPIYNNKPTTQTNVIQGQQQQYNPGQSITGQGMSRFNPIQQGTTGLSSSSSVSHQPSHSMTHLHSTVPIQSSSSVAPIPMTAGGSAYQQQQQLSGQQLSGQQQQLSHLQQQQQQQQQLLLQQQQKNNAYNNSNIPDMGNTSSLNRGSGGSMYPQQQQSDNNIQSFGVTTSNIGGNYANINSSSNSNSNNPNIRMNPNISYNNNNMSGGNMSHSRDTTSSSSSSSYSNMSAPVAANPMKITNHHRSMRWSMGLVVILYSS